MESRAVACCGAAGVAGCDCCVVRRDGEAKAFETFERLAAVLSTDDDAGYSTAHLIPAVTPVPLSSTNHGRFCPARPPPMLPPRTLIIDNGAHTIKSSWLSTSTPPLYVPLPPSRPAWALTR